MKKRNSKKGFTLVELIVTIAILSITASMGTSIFIMVLNNYGVASDASFSQQQAVAVEDMLREYCKTSKEVKFAAGDVDALAVKPTGNYTYFYTKSDGVLYIDHCEGASSTHTKLTLTGIKTLQTKYIKRVSGLDANAGYIVMQYTITTNNDFVLEGSIVLNNSDSLSCSTLAPGSGASYDLNTNATQYMEIT